MQFSSSDACYCENGSVIAFILPNYPWKRSFEEVGDSTKDKLHERVLTTLIPCFVVYEKTMAFYLAVCTVPPSGTAMQTTFA